MRTSIHLFLSFLLIPLAFHVRAEERKTEVSIKGPQFLINGAPTYQGVTWKNPEGKPIPMEGLLMNARVVQGIFDDLNPETRDKWAYKDTGKWDPERNTDEFIKAMESWRKQGLLAFTLNLQGGSPEEPKNVTACLQAVFTCGTLLRSGQTAVVEAKRQNHELGGVCANPKSLENHENHKIPQELS